MTMPASRSLRSRLAPFVFMACSLALHVLVFLGLPDSPRPLPEPVVPERRLEVSFIVEPRPEPEKLPQENQPPEEISSQVEIASKEQKPRQEGDRPGLVRQRPAPAMPESGVVRSADVPPAPSMSTGRRDLDRQIPASTPDQATPVAVESQAEKTVADLAQHQTVAADTATMAAETTTETLPDDQVADRTAPQLSFSQERVTAIPQPEHVYGKMRPLDDAELADVRASIDGDDPDAPRWRAISQQLVKLEQQIYSAWNGQGKWPMHLGGVIRFQLTEKGTLQKVYVQLGSGRTDFDQSILDAIRRVIERGTAETRQLASMNYLYFRFQYSAGGRPRQSGELLPWEREKIVAGELGQNTGS